MDHYHLQSVTKTDARYFHLGSEKQQNIMQGKSKQGEIITFVFFDSYWR